MMMSPDARANETRRLPNKNDGDTMRFAIMCSLLVLLVFANDLRSVETARYSGPIIDMHLHTDPPASAVGMPNPVTGKWVHPAGRGGFHAFLQQAIGRGFGKRILFGSDQMAWPDAIGLAIEGVDSADFLTMEQKRDIFYANAVRFLRLKEPL
jgi:hypothetical protein